MLALIGCSAVYADTTNTASTSEYSNYTATAYCLQGKTADGSKVRKGIVAADPRVLPLGATIDIKDKGVFKVADTGGAIKGTRLDIWMGSCSDARQFGRQTVQVKIISTKHKSPKM